MQAIMQDIMEMGILMLHTLLLDTSMYEMDKCKRLHKVGEEKKRKKRLDFCLASCLSLAMNETKFSDVDWMSRILN